MKNRKYSLVFIMLLCMIMAVSAFPMTVNADMGPKASVRIHFAVEGEIYWSGKCLGWKNGECPERVHGSWYLGDLCELQGSGWILFSAAELEGK